MNNMYHVIMCGGIGSRFWPMSTKDYPKQFLKLIEDKSLIRLTVDRLLQISSPDNFILSSVLIIIYVFIWSSNLYWM